MRLKFIHIVLWLALAIALIVLNILLAGRAANESQVKQSGRCEVEFK